MRTTKPLADITDAAWLALEDGCVGYVRVGGVPQPLPPGVPDPRLSLPPSSTNPVTYIVHRHVIRAAQSNCHAVKESIRLGTHLYVSTACDNATDKKGILFTDDVRQYLLGRANLHRVKNLLGILLLYRGMRLLLYSKLCVRLLLMNGCECILADLIFAVEEFLPPMVFAGTPIALKYMPSQLLLRAVGAQ